MRPRTGQSLLEIMVALAIGSVLIGAAAIAISAVLSANLSLQKSQSAAALNQELLDKMQGVTLADWKNISSLAKGSSTQYFLVASGSATFIISGKEGLIDNDASPGLVGEWKMDETSGTRVLDSSGNGSEGVLSNAADRAPGKLSAAGVFSPWATSHAVSIPQRAILNPQGPFTISAWINVSSYQPDTGNWQTVIEGSGNLNSNNGYYLGFNGWAATFDFMVGNGTSWIVSQSVTQTAVPLNTWTHVAAVMDATSSSIFVNGNRVAYGPRTLGSVGYGPYPVTIGSLSYSIGAHPLDGLIDDVRIYNRALLPTEVKQLAGGNVYTRYFSVENVCRTLDAQGSISGAAPCGGGTAIDPSTLYVTVYVNWQGGTKSGEVKSGDFITRFENAIFRQTDWSGGSGAAGPFTDPNNGYASGTSIGVTSGGGITILGF